jgi:anti-anti-sigma regulatory factor
MLKITVRRDAESESVTFLLEGRLTGPWVEELERCWREILESGTGSLVVDLADVTFIEQAGKVLLARMWRDGAKLLAAGCCTKSIVQEIMTGGPATPSSVNQRDQAKKR